MTPKEKKILLEFLQTLFLPEDNVCIGLIEPEKEQARQIYKIGYQNILSTIEFLDTSRSGATCIVPNPIKEKKKRLIENVEKLNALFIDIDNKELDLKNLPVPHYIFKRGEKNFHCYWLIERIENTTANRKKYTEAAEHIIEIANGDKGVKDVSRFLRMPYTFYDKKPKQKGYELYEKNDLPRYDLNEFLPAPKKNKKLERGSAVTKEHPPLAKGEVEHFLLNHKIGKIAAGEGRSRFLYYFGLDCYSWGIEQERALELAFEYNEKVCDPPERDRNVRHQIASAYKYARGNFGEYKEKSKVDGAVKAFEAYQIDNAVREYLRNWTYVMEAERFINLETGVELTTTTQIENFLAHVTGKGVTLKHIFKKQLIKVCDRMDFRPDKEKRFFKSRNVLYFNRFGGLKEFEEVKNDIAVKAFQEHLKLITTSREEYEHLQNFLAYNIQNPGKKIDHAILIISKYEGLGKSLLERLCRNMLQAKREEDYVIHVENTEIMDKNTDFMAGKLLCFVHELAQGDKYATMNKLKSLITEGTVRIIAKYARTYTIRNTVNFILFSNLIDAIKIGKYDRRLYVIYNDKEPKDEKYYKKIIEIFKEDYPAIRNYLGSIDLSKFNPHKKPAMTKGKTQLQEQSQSELSIFLGHCEQNGEGPFENKLLLIDDLLTHVESFGPKNIQGRTSYKQIRTWLTIERDYIYEDIDRRIKITQKETIRLRNRIFYRKVYTPILEDFLLLAKKIGE